MARGSGFEEPGPGQVQSGGGAHTGVAALKSQWPLVQCRSFVQGAPSASSGTHVNVLSLQYVSASKQRLPDAHDSFGPGPCTHVPAVVSQR